MSILNEYINYLNEGKTSSTSVISRQGKVNRAVGSLVVQKAREKNDPLYRHMKYYKELYKKFKAKIHQKYSSGVRQQAMK